MKLFGQVCALAMILLSACNNQENSTTNINTDTVNTKVDTSTSVNIELPKVENAFVYGVDISKYQGNELDFLTLNEDSIEFVICKATQGMTYVDPDLESNWELIKEKNFIGGLYHFYVSKDDPVKQAENFVSHLAKLSEDHLPAIIDVEGEGIDSKMTVEEVQENLLAFIAAIEAKQGRTPIIYTNGSIGNKYLNSEDFKKYPLWIADYSATVEPKLPGAWQDLTWIFWQKSDHQTVVGKKNDFDVYNGSIADLKAFIKKH